MNLKRLMKISFKHKILGSYFLRETRSQKPKHLINQYENNTAKVDKLLVSFVEVIRSLKLEMQVANWNVLNNGIKFFH